MKIFSLEECVNPCIIISDYWMTKVTGAVVLFTRQIDRGPGRTFK